MSVYCSWEIYFIGEGCDELPKRFDLREREIYSNANLLRNEPLLREGQLTSLEMGCDRVTFDELPIMVWEGTGAIVTDERWSAFILKGFTVSRDIADQIRYISIVYPEMLIAVKCCCEMGSEDIYLYKDGAFECLLLYDHNAPEYSTGPVFRFDLESNNRGGLDLYKGIFEKACRKILEAFDEGGSTAAGKEYLRQCVNLITRYDLIGSLLCPYLECIFSEPFVPKKSVID